MHEIEATVSGRVQNVMFRDFVQRNARSLRITGYVENMPDGTVHLVAQGDAKTLKMLIERLHTGSFFSRVDSVDFVWNELRESFDGFAIRY